MGLVSPSPRLFSGCIFGVSCWTACAWCSQIIQPWSSSTLFHNPGSAVYELHRKKYIHSPHGGSAQCWEVHKSSVSFCLHFQQDIYTCKSIIAAHPCSVNNLCPQIRVCWMSLRSQPLWPLPAVHPKPGNPTEWWPLGLNLVPFGSSLFYPFLAELEHRKTTFCHPTVLCPMLCLFFRRKSWDGELGLLEELCRTT